MYHDGAITVALGNTYIRMSCRDREFMEKLVSDYQPFLVSKSPDLSVYFDVREQLEATEIQALLRKSSAHKEGDRYYTEPDLIECRLQWNKATLEVATEKNLFSADVEYKFMNLLLTGLYSGIFRKLRKASFDKYLVHGCGIHDGNKCYLFTGPSGSGKTTVASLAEGRKILNDETVLIGRNGDGFCLAGTPFDGGVSERSNDSHRLSSIFFLKHDRQVTVRELKEVETYKRLLAQVFDTSPLFDLPDHDSFTEQAQLCSEIAASVPAYELGFLPDSSFWQYVEIT